MKKCICIILVIAVSILSGCNSSQNEENVFPQNFKEYYEVSPYGNEEEIYTRPLLAKVGNELLNIAEIKAVFVAGRVDKDKIAISARSKTEVNVQLIMEKLGGGGHFSMAACQVEEKTVKETIDKLEEAIDQYLDERG